MHPKIYTGRRLRGVRPVVRVIGPAGDSRLLRVHPSLCTYSRTFEWGFSGSGPAQLSFEILFDVLGDARLARQLHYHFMSAQVASLPRNRPWKIRETDVVLWAAKFAGEEEQK